MIGRKSLIIASSQIFARILGWLGIVILAKFWGGFAPEALGVIGFAIAFLSIFSIIANLGFDLAHVKRVSEGQDLGTCIGTYITIKLMLIALMVVAIFTGIYIWKTYLGGGFTDATTESVVYVFVVYYVFLTLRNISTFTFGGTKEIVKRQIIMTFENIVKIPLMIFVVLAGVSIGTRVFVSPAFEWPGFLQPLQNFLSLHALGSLAMAYVFGIITSFLIGVWFLRQYKIKKPTKLMAKRYFVFALPMMLIAVIGVISTNIDKIMIGYFWTKVEVGYYFTVQQVLEIITVLALAVEAVLFPTLSEFHSLKNLKGIKNKTLQAERYISMIIVPVAVVIIVLVKPVINIMLSGSFLPAAAVLITLTLYAYLISMMIPFSSLIGGVDRPSIAAKISIIVCLVNILLNYLFIPENGLLSYIGINGPTGAAVATVISGVIGFIGLRLAARKLTKIKILQSHTPRHIIAGIIMGGILFYLSGFVYDFRFYYLVAFAFLGLGIYLFLLFLLREFKKEDFKFFVGLFNPKEMVKYVSSELKSKPPKDKK